jgi:hypothetical protein
MTSPIKTFSTCRFEWGSLSRGVVIISIEWGMKNGECFPGGEVSMMMTAREFSTNKIDSGVVKNHVIYFLQPVNRIEYTLFILLE